MNTLERNLEIKSMRQAGSSLKEIAKIFGISRQRVDQILKQVHKYITCLRCNQSFARKGNEICCFDCLKKYGRLPSGRDSVREKVRIRDNYMCQFCFKIWQQGSRKFDVHHLHEMKASKNYDDKKKMINLITLCHPCHMRLHMKYRTPGKKFGMIPLDVFPNVFLSPGGYCIAKD